MSELFPSESAEQAPRVASVIEFEFNDARVLDIQTRENSRKLFRETAPAPEGVRRSIQSFDHRHDGNFSVVAIIGLSWVGATSVLTKEYVLELATTQLLGFLSDLNLGDVSPDRVLLTSAPIFEDQAYDASHTTREDLTIEARVIEARLRQLLNSDPANFLD